MEIKCSNSIKEGGLVAQAAFDGCKHAGDSLGRPYCEFRDDASSSSATLENRVKGVKVSITASTTGSYGIGVDSGSLKMGSSSSDLTTSQIYNHTLQQGKTYSFEYEIWASPNYVKGDTKDVEIHVLPSGWINFNDSIGSCKVTIIDDDNTAYIGRRNYHPYGGTWQGTPCCYSHNCAYKAGNC